MALLSPARTLVPAAPVERPPGLVRRRAAGWRSRRALARRLAHQDRLGARLAQQRTVEEVLVRAEALVADGWVQGAWFGYAAPEGPRLSHLPGGRTEAAAAAADRFCLVSAVHAATGQVTGRAPGPRLSRPDRPVADRAVDTVWRTLVGSGSGPASPPPEVRALRRLDLTRWNDAAERTADDVRQLLARAAGRAGTERERTCLALVTDG